MSKLDPRPDSRKLYSWEDLNEYIQMNIQAPGNIDTIIDVRNYTMTKSEIITEAESKGYKVIAQGEHKLKFE